MFDWIMTYWSYVLTPLGIAGLWLTGRRISWGWLVGLVNQVLWLFYTLVTRQWGFLPSILVFMYLCTKSFVEWRRDDLAKARASSSVPAPAVPDKVL